MYLRNSRKRNVGLNTAQLCLWIVFFKKCIAFPGLEFTWVIIINATLAYVGLALNEMYYLYIKFIFNSLNIEDS